MQTAIAARVGSTVPELVKIPCPQPPEIGGCDDILCRTLELGVCGTDREILHSANPWTPPESPFLVLGHECIARSIRSVTKSS